MFGELLGGVGGRGGTPGSLKDMKDMKGHDARAKAPRHDLHPCGVGADDTLPVGLKLIAASWRLNEREVWRERCSGSRGRLMDLLVWAFS